MFGFLRLSIAGRIYASFAVMIGLLVVLTVLAVAGVQLLSGTLNGFRTSAEDATRVRAMTASLTSARLAAADYMTHPTEARVTQLLASTASLRDEAGGAGLPQEQLDALDAYSGLTTDMVQRDAVLSADRALLEETGLRATETLSAMIAASSQSANLNAKVAAMAGLGMQHLLQLRLSVNALILQPDAATLASTQDEAESARAALLALRGSFFKTDDIAQVDAVLSGLEAFEAAIVALYGQLQVRAGLMESLAANSATMEASFSAAAFANDAQYSVTAAASEASAAKVQFGVLLAGLVSLAAGIGLAVIVASWLSRTIRRLAAATEQMAGGDFSVVLPKSEHGNELGRIAQALAVFGANGRALEEQQQDKAIAAAAQQVEQAQRDRLQGQIALIAQRAARGDFTQRLATDYDLADLADVAKTVNELIAMVDRGLSETGGVLMALAEADLTRRVLGEYEGAFAGLKRDTNAVADRLSEIMGELRQTSRALRSATAEILSGADDLAERTTRQAVALEATSLTMVQLAGTVRDNAARTEEANRKAGLVTQTAESGGVVIVEANAAMERITHASTKISTIIRLIDDIAFQTNLLALNASVEAARAGEAGRGFAVVAVEVRRLAQSAARASADVKELIETSSQEVSHGSKLVAKASVQLAEVESAVRDNGILLGEIAVASREQAGAIEGAYEAIRHMDEMTRHNATLVEEMNATLGQTEVQARELDRVVDMFSLDEPTKIEPQFRGLRERLARAS